MSNPERPKVAYLLGTGATNAEKLLECKIKNTGIDDEGTLQAGLTNNDVSKRVINKLLDEHPEILKTYGIEPANIETVYGLKKVDIELFISLVCTIDSEDAARDGRILKKYFRQDICDNLKVTGEPIGPRLLPSLIEWHDLEECNEELLGFLTLNYDSILETALSIKQKKFDYGIRNIQVDDSMEFLYESGNPYVLKLHGSFDWFYDEGENKIIVKSEGEPTALIWVPPQLYKGYNEAPFLTIHKKAQDLLNKCDILRVIGCSLSSNDISLISLLFKTQSSRRPDTYSIEFIGKEETFREIVRDRLGSFLSFEEELFYRKDNWTRLEKERTENTFLDWLYYKKNNTTSNNINSTDNLKHIDSWSKL